MYRLLSQAGWAPIAVLLLHQVVIRTSLRQELNWAVHCLGGAAAGYFLYSAVLVGERHLGRLRPLAQYLLAFGLACAVAIGWEVCEFAAGRQDGLTDTMGDLAFGMVGAALSLMLIAAYRPARREWG
jgi:hypothetical protein